MEKKLRKKYLRFYNLLIAIFPIIFLKEFIELSINSDEMIKNVKLAELNISFANVFLNIQTLKMI